MGGKLELRLNRRKCITSSIFLVALLLLFLSDFPNIVESVLNNFKAGAGLSEVLQSDEGFRLTLLSIIVPIFIWTIKIYLYDGIIKKKIVCKITPDGIWISALKENSLIPWSAIEKIEYDRKIFPLFSARAHIFIISPKMRKKYNLAGFSSNPRLLKGAYNKADKRIKFELDKYFNLLNPENVS